MPPKTHNEKSGKSDDPENDFRQALARLVQGKPLNPDLKPRALQGKLRINPSTVAMEAGRSRTLIGFDDCAYPEVRAAIKAHMEANGEGDGNPEAERATAEKIIQRLRHENRILASEKAALATQVMNALNYARSLEKKVKKLKRETERAAKRGHPNQVVGVSESLGGTVIAFPRDSEH